MTVQWSTALRNNLLAEFASTIGASPTLCFYTGAQPANCAAAASGTLLATFNLNATWMSTPSAGSSTMEDGGNPVSTSNPYDVTAVAAGNIGYYRIYDSSGNCHEQGSVTATGGGGDMTVDNVSLAAGQNVQITGYTKNAAGA